MSNMLMSRRSSGLCLCKMCVPPKHRKRVRGTYRATANRSWRQDVRDLDQGQSWLGEELEILSLSGTPASELSYWEAMDRIEDISDSYPLPYGFDGTWSSVRDGA